jgi:hypothetical protein
VLQYLSRYTHRTAIGNERILRLQGDEVVISARAKRDKGKAGGEGEERTLLGAQDFMARVARVNIQQRLVCGQGRMSVVQTLEGAQRLPDPFERGARKANRRAPQGP